MQKEVYAGTYFLKKHYAYMIYGHRALVDKLNGVHTLQIILFKSFTVLRKKIT